MTSERRARVAAERYRARKLLSQPSNIWRDLTKIVLRANGRCLYCEQPTANLTLDHFIPLGHGGRDVPLNLIPACRRCNSRKGDNEPFRWLAALGSVAEDRVADFFWATAMEV